MAGSFHLRRDLMAIGLLVLGAIIGGFLSVRAPALPSDADLRKRFDEHRAAFDSLATRAIAGTPLAEADSSLAQVRPRLERLGVSRVSRERNGRAVWFVVETRDGSRKGYVYSLEPLQPLLSSLDAANQNGFVALAPRWFLFLQSAD